VNPRIRNKNLYDLYSSQYFTNESNGYENYELLEDLRIKTFKKWYLETEPFLKKKEGKALDIGCAAGYFLKILEEKNWEVEGIELEDNMNNIVRSKGYTVYNTPLEYFETKKKYHLISLFDVLEHLPKLNIHIQKLYRLLEDDGSIILVTPDLNSKQRKFFGKRWFQFKPLEHIQYFTCQSLGKVFRKHDLSIIYSNSSGQYVNGSFIISRLRRYNFPLLAIIFHSFFNTFRLRNLSWYADTGSMIVVLQKTK
jgi:2-polyprenyl-3-methyl-5-hydroxy-6-metoxy-1,4-benzoquinol methylase